MRTLRVFFLVVLISGPLPTLSLEAPPHLPDTLRGALSICDGVVAAAAVVAQTAPDPLIRARAGHALESLPASRPPAVAIFAGMASLGTLAALRILDQ